MLLVRIMQRKDAASLVVAIAAGLVVFNFLVDITAHLTAALSGVDHEFDFAADYWRPVLTLVLQLLVLEGLARLAVAVRGELVRRR